MHTYARRWTRERERDRLIAQISPGKVLYRTYRGQQHEVTCHEGYWLYKGQRYPTLYSVVEAITGARPYPAQMKHGQRPEGTRRMAAWSAKRFFELEAIVPRDLGLDGP